ncbi:MAG: M20/M25/M40 family metallo-hydrolase [Thermomicrobiales bacterium]
MVKGIATAMRAEADVTFDFGYPTLINDHAMTDLVRGVVRDVGGSCWSASRAWSADMAYFLQRVPGCFFMVGTNNVERGLIHGHHHPRFDIDDEAALPVGVATLATVALRYLNRA